jgi:ubiquinone/menaquinone biosynthesis C-methylase UbiE
VEWNKDSFKKLNEYRSIFRDVNKEIVNSILDKYLNGCERILEIGSGCGELCNLAEKYEKHIIQSDVSQELCKINKRNGREVIRANAYSLPFKDNSLDAVIGYAVLDNLEETRKTIAEIHRVLKQNGKFIHFLDVGAFPVGILKDVVEKYSKEYVILPYADKEEIGIALLSRDSYEEIQDFLSPAALLACELWSRNPIEAAKFYFSTGADYTLYRVSREIELFAKNLKVYKFNKLFLETSRKEFESLFEPILFEVKEAKKIKKDKKLVKKFRGNRLINNLGNLKIELCSEIPPEHVEIVTKMHVMVYQKI